MRPAKAVKVNNRYGNVPRKIRFIPCSKRNAGVTTRAEIENCKYEITVGVIISVGKNQVLSGCVGYNHGYLVITKFRGYLVT